MKLPRSFVTAYLVKDEGAQGALAGALHGVNIPRYTWGYSFWPDLSIVARLPNGETGTLVHELVHLLVRSHFGDAPPWLHEGLAMLYEASEIGPKGTFRGIPSYRGEMRKMGGSPPSLEELVGYGWDRYTNASEDQPFIHAATRSFMLYLQERGALEDIYRRLRERDIATVSEPMAEASVHALEASLHQKLGDIQADFIKWTSGSCDVPSNGPPTPPAACVVPPRPGACACGLGESTHAQNGAVGAFALLLLAWRARRARRITEPEPARTS
jgi:hypothetical protein